MSSTSMSWNEHKRPKMGCQMWPCILRRVTKSSYLNSVRKMKIESSAESGLGGKKRRHNYSKERICR